MVYHGPDDDMPCLDYDDDDDVDEGLYDGDEDEDEDEYETDYDDEDEDDSDADGQLRPPAYPHLVTAVQYSEVSSSDHDQPDEGSLDGAASSGEGESEDECPGLTRDEEESDDECPGLTRDSDDDDAGFTGRKANDAPPVHPFMPPPLPPRWAPRRATVLRGLDDNDDSDDDSDDEDDNRYRPQRNASSWLPRFPGATQPRKAQPPPAPPQSKPAPQFTRNPAPYAQVPTGQRTEGPERLRRQREEVAQQEAAERRRQREQEQKEREGWEQERREREAKRRQDAEVEQREKEAKRQDAELEQQRARRARQRAQRGGETNERANVGKDFFEMQRREIEELRKKKGFGKLDDIVDKNRAVREAVKKRLGRCCTRPGGLPQQYSAPGQPKVCLKAPEFHVTRDEKWVRMLCSCGCNILFHKECWGKVFLPAFQTFLGNRTWDMKDLKTSTTPTKCPTNGCSGFLVKIESKESHNVPWPYDAKKSVLDQIAADKLAKQQAHTELMARQRSKKHQQQQEDHVMAAAAAAAARQSVPTSAAAVPEAEPAEVSAAGPEVAEGAEPQPREKRRWKKKKPDKGLQPKAPVDEAGNTLLPDDEQLRPHQRDDVDELRVESRRPAPVHDNLQDLLPSQKKKKAQIKLNLNDLHKTGGVSHQALQFDPEAPESPKVEQQRPDLHQDFPSLSAAVNTGSRQPRTAAEPEKKAAPLIDFRNLKAGEQQMTHHLLFENIGIRHVCDVHKPTPEQLSQAFALSIEHQLHQDEGLQHAFVMHSHVFTEEQALALSFGTTGNKLDAERVASWVYQHSFTRKLELFYPRPGFPSFRIPFTTHYYLTEFPSPEVLIQHGCIAITPPEPAVSVAPVDSDRTRASGSGHGAAAPGRTYQDVFNSKERKGKNHPLGVRTRYAEDGQVFSSRPECPPSPTNTETASEAGDYPAWMAGTDPVTGAAKMAAAASKAASLLNPHSKEFVPSGASNTGGLCPPAPEIQPPPPQPKSQTPRDADSGSATALLGKRMVQGTDRDHGRMVRNPEGGCESWARSSEAENDSRRAHPCARSSDDVGAGGEQAQLVANQQHVEPSANHLPDHNRMRPNPSPSTEGLRQSASSSTVTASSAAFNPSTGGLPLSTSRSAAHSSSADCTPATSGLALSTSRSAHSSSAGFTPATSGLALSASRSAANSSSSALTPSDLSPSPPVPQAPSPAALMNAHPSWASTLIMLKLFTILDDSMWTDWQNLMCEVSLALSVEQSDLQDLPREVWPSVGLIVRRGSNGHLHGVWKFDHEMVIPGKGPEPLLVWSRDGDWRRPPVPPEFYCEVTGRTDDGLEVALGQTEEDLVTIHEAPLVSMVLSMFEAAGDRHFLSQSPPSPPPSFVSHSPSTPPLSFASSGSHYTTSDQVVDAATVVPAEATTWQGAWQEEHLAAGAQRIVDNESMKAMVSVGPARARTGACYEHLPGQQPTVDHTLSVQVGENPNSIAHLQHHRTLNPRPQQSSPLPQAHLPSYKPIMQKQMHNTPSIPIIHTNLPSKPAVHMKHSSRMHAFEQTAEYPHAQPHYMLCEPTSCPTNPSQDDIQLPTHNTDPRSRGAELVRSNKCVHIPRPPVLSTHMADHDEHTPTKQIPRRKYTSQSSNRSTPSQSPPSYTNVHATLRVHGEEFELSQPRFYSSQHDTSSNDTNAKNTHHNPVPSSHHEMCKLPRSTHAPAQATNPQRLAMPFVGASHSSRCTTRMSHTHPNQAIIPTAYVGPNVEPLTHTFSTSSLSLPRTGPCSTTDVSSPRSTITITSHFSDDRASSPDTASERSSSKLSYPSGVLTNLSSTRTVGTSRSVDTPHATDMQTPSYLPSMSDAVATHEEFEQMEYMNHDEPSVLHHVPFMDSSCIVPPNSEQRAQPYDPLVQSLGSSQTLPGSHPYSNSRGEKPIVSEGHHSKSHNMSHMLPILGFYQNASQGNRQPPP